MAKTKYRFYNVGGLPEMVIFRTPQKGVPQKVLYPALTKMAQHYGARQKDICFLEYMAGWDEAEFGPDSDYALFETGFESHDKLVKFDLWDWDAESREFTLHRARTVTRQMEMADWARKFASAFPEGHPGHCDPDQVEWRRDGYFPLELLGAKEVWLNWHASELSRQKVAGTEDQFVLNVSDRHQAIVVVYRGKTPYVWGPKERMAGAHLRGEELVSAIIAYIPE